ncbi:hypothetical protein EON65_35810 [archaeon]|nr:MAG: hypothetical protein EON65_35810 [archaeon]
MERAFICNKKDIDNVFDNLSLPGGDGEGDSVITAASLHKMYSPYSDLTEEDLQQGLKKFQEIYCNSSTPFSGSMDKGSFFKGIENYSATLMAEGKADEGMKVIFKLAIKYANNDPREFAKMLNLPPVIKISEVEELMAYLVK